jgi:cytochrome P450
MVIRPGQRVSLVIAAANRDPEVYPEPDHFRLTQTARPHLSFGAGAHFCLGAPVARLILTEAIRAFAGWLGGRPVTEVADIRQPAFGHLVWDRATVAL